MVLYGDDLKQRNIKFEPRIKLNDSSLKYLSTYCSLYNSLSCVKSFSEEEDFKKPKKVKLKSPKVCTRLF